MDKISKERYVLESAKSTLGVLYGYFDVIPEQVDSPDAAILLKHSGTKIGIEITSVDKNDVQQYLNDKKAEKDITEAQLEALLFEGKYSDRPTKKISIPFPSTYIFDSAIKKADKYPIYMESGGYDEVILIASSDYLKIEHEHFEVYHKPWTWFLLSRISFPFDKVVFVCEQSQKSVVVYDKSTPQLTEPSCNTDKELGITAIQGPILPIGEKVILSGYFNKDPLISIDKGENKRERKEKRKAQKKSRRANRN